MPIDYIAAALDPRTKNLSFLRSNEERQAVWIHLDQLMAKMRPNAEEAATIPDGGKDDVMDLLEASPEKKSPARVKSRRSLFCVELTEYLEGENAMIREDPLLWWHSKEVGVDLFVNSG